MEKSWVMMMHQIDEEHEEWERKREHVVHKHNDDAVCLTDALEILRGPVCHAGLRFLTGVRPRRGRFFHVLVAEHAAQHHSPPASNDLVLRGVDERVDAATGVDKHRKHLIEDDDRWHDPESCQD